MSDFPPSVPSLFSVWSASLIVSKKGDGIKAEQKVGSALEGFLPRESLVSLLTSALQARSWHVETFKKRIRVTGSSSLSFLYLHLHLSTCPHIVQVSSVLYKIRCTTTSRIQFAPVFVHINWGVTLPYSPQTCVRISLMSGVTLDYCQDQKQPEAESARGQKSQG